MAQKDWKRIIDDGDYIEWKNKDDFKWVGVNKTTNKTWHTGGNRINEKDFKTKSQALSYAKNYMRNN